MVGLDWVLLGFELEVGRTERKKERKGKIWTIGKKSFDRDFTLGLEKVPCPLSFSFSSKSHLSVDSQVSEKCSLGFAIKLECLLKYINADFI